MNLCKLKIKLNKKKPLKFLGRILKIKYYKIKIFVYYQLTITDMHVRKLKLNL